MKQYCDPAKVAHGLLALAALAALMSAIVFFRGQVIFSLAGTQWILIAIALGVFAANVHLCTSCAKKSKKVIEEDTTVCVCDNKSCLCSKA